MYCDMPSNQCVLNDSQKTLGRRLQFPAYFIIRQKTNKFSSLHATFPERGSLPKIILLIFDAD